MSKISKNKFRNRLIIPLREAAEMLYMCRQTLLEYVMKAELPYVRLAKDSVFFRLEDLEIYVNDKLVRFAPVKIPEVNEVQ